MLLLLFSGKSCPTLCKPMDYSMSGFPVHDYLLEFAQTHIHWASDAIQPSHPLSSPCPPALNLSQHQGLFQWVGLSHQVAKVLELHLQASVLPVTIWAWFPLRLTGFISLLSKGLESSRAPQFKSIFFGAQSSLWSYSHHCRSVHITTGKTIALTIWTFLEK